MRLRSLVVTAVLIGAPALAEPPQSSSAQTATSAAADANLPVSIDRIREGLTRPTPSILLRTDKAPDFKSQVEEQEKLNEIIGALDFRGGVVPPGGPYAYEQQRLMFNSVDRPLMQPYAAFNGGELITIATESLARVYLGNRLASAVTNTEREHAEHAAHLAVARSIDAYCAAQPHGGAGISLCAAPPDGTPIRP